MKKIIFIIFLFTIANLLHAQELKCVVKINTPKLQNADPRVFQTLQKAIFEFMNNKKWTTDLFENHEKIECNMLINVNEETGNDKYKLQVTIQSSRATFNSNYNTTLFNFADKDLEIQYVEYQPLEYTDNKYSSNLTSILAYYAYTIIGLDYDSFSPKGGTVYFEAAKNIVTQMQNQDEAGWKPFEKNLKNRYWLNENITGNTFASIHTIYYNYHRLGLDNMYNDANAGRAAILATLKLVEKIFEDNPNAIWLSVFFGAKADELTNIFMSGNPQEKQTAYALLNKCDPLNNKKYAKILSGK
jgi:hypothetical protein